MFGRDAFLVNFSVLIDIVFGTLKEGTIPEFDKSEYRESKITNVDGDFEKTVLDNCWSKMRVPPKKDGYTMCRFFLRKVVESIHI